MGRAIKLSGLVCILIFMHILHVNAGVYGHWLTEENNLVVKISKCGNAICGKILSGVPKHAKDVRNKNPKLRGRRLKGMQFFKLLPTKNPKKWQGELYNARDGKTYSGNIKLIDAQHLQLEGCVFIFCKTAKWVRK